MSYPHFNFPQSPMDRLNFLQGLQGMQQQFPTANYVTGTPNGQTAAPPTGQLPLGGTPLLGQMMNPGGGLTGAPMQPGQHGGHHGGMSPLMALSPLLGMFMSGHPNFGLGMISPALGIARGLGAFK
jgi:hypothetical protein